MLGTYGKLPLNFEANHGQSDARVKYLARGRGYSLFLTANDAVMTLRKAGAKTQEPAVAVLRYSLPGANPAPEISPLGQLPGKSNYLIGKDSTKWHTNIPNYAKVRYGQVYPGVDLLYYGNERRLEFDFEVAPGADPRAIRLAVDGSRRLRLAEQGDLIIETPAGEARLLQPRSYQEVDGKIQTVASRYILEGTNTVRLELGPYDATRKLVIDPVVEPSGQPILGYSTYLGGSAFDTANGIAVDPAGHAYLVGTTVSTNFPLTNAGNGSLQALDVFVTKLSADGQSLVYSTYLGGGGNGSNYGQGIAINTLGNAYVTGYTDSANFPMQNPLPAPNNALQGSLDAFVTELNETGDALLYSTYLGGSSIDYGYGIAVDAAGNAYVTGITDSANFPALFPLPAPNDAYQGNLDAFVTKIDPTKTGAAALIYSTYLGGSGDDRGAAIAVDGSGNAYVTGETQSGNFPTLNPLPAPNNALQGAVDAFVTKIGFSGLGSASLIYSTYLGGSDAEHGYGIAVDYAGNAYVTGDTRSSDFPTGNPLPAPNNALQGVQDAFVTELSTAGSSILHSTYLGGSDTENGYGIAVDDSGNAYVTGITSSTNFPVTLGAMQATLVPGSGGTCEGTCADAFVARIDAAGDNLVYSTYLGGAGDERASGISNDKMGNSYIAGSTSSTDFPTASPLQAAKAGSTDAFTSKIAGPSAIRYLSEFATNTLTGNDDGSTGLVPIGFTVNFFGQEYSSLYVNNNGNVTFDESLETYTPFGLTGANRVIIAPFFADVDTRPSNSWKVTYGQGIVDGRQAFGINWVNVGYYPDGTDKLLSAQLVLIDRSPQQAVGQVSASATVPVSGDFDIEFNYDKAQWETGSASGGSGGLGGSSARAGFSNGTGDPGTSYELPGSAVNGAFLDNNTATGLIYNSKDSTNLGRYVFQVRGGSVIGVTGDIGFTPPNLSFESNVDIICSAKRVTATNVAANPVTVADVSVSGPFNMNTDCRGKTLAPGQSCIVTVLFLPQGEAGTYPGTVTVTTGANSQSTLPITGIATPPCRLNPDTQVATVVRGSNLATFTIADSSPSCFTKNISLSCAGQEPATCAFASQVIRPAGSTAVTVSNLAALPANELNFRVLGTANEHSAAVNLTVRLSDFAFAVSAPTASVAAGSSATYNLSMQPINGLSGQVSLSCSGAPSGANCSVTPASLAMNGSTVVPFKVTVTTTARSLGAPGPGPLTLPPILGRWIGLTGVLWLMALAMLAGLVGRRHGARRALLGLTVALLFVLLWAACAGGGNMSRQSLLVGTPSGTYALTIQANYSAGSSGADLSHSTTVTLQVQ